MNKTKKIAVAAVSVVMAGTMVFSITGCGPKTPSGPSTDDTIKELTYDKGTTVTTSIGYSTTDTTAISYSTKTLPLLQGTAEANTEIKLPDGKTYKKGDLKPIWQSYQEALDIKISDRWTQASSNLPECVTQGLSNYDIIGAGSTTDIQTQVDAGTLLNLNEYIDYMPNLRNFLNNNALAKLGTMADAETGAFYYVPYYAGMDDAERYNLFRKDYVSQLLDKTNDATKNGGTVSFAAQATKKKELKLGNRQAAETYVSNKSSIKSYMGQTGSYVVKTTDPSDNLKTVFVKVDYDAALTAAKNADSELGKAIVAGAGKTYNGTSGNVVDLQNFVIDETSGEVKGEHLLNILKEYIKVAYKWADSETATSWAQFYGAKVNNVDTKLSDIINSTYAAWDVDIYAAIGRVFVTCGNMLGAHQSQALADTNYGASTWLFVPRTGYTNRTTRLTAMIGELYGVRGMEGMEYLDSSGTLRQTRFNVSTWDALSQFSAFHTEGLVPSFNTTDVNGEIGSIGSNSAMSLYDGNKAHFQGLSSNDFIHTQTTISGNEYANEHYVETEDGYKWTGVVTPVSRWLTDDKSTVNSSTGAITIETDGLLKDRPAAKTTVMRFTESALKLKTGGLVVPKSTANDQNRLHATLALIDYLYSNDGLIVTSFGDISTKDDLSGDPNSGYTTTNDGWWYGKPVTNLSIDGTNTDISEMTMEQLAEKGVVETHDNGKQYTMTKEYQGYALVYKNKLYKTGVEDSTSQYDVNKGGYVYNGVMTPYFTRAARILSLEGKSVNGYTAGNVKITYKKDENGKDTTEEAGREVVAAVYSSTNLQNLVLGQEGFGIVNNAGMVQLCNDQAVEGFDTFGVALGNGSTRTVEQAISDNPWFTCAPSITLPKASSDIINSYADFSSVLFKTGSNITNYFILEVGWYGANASFGDWNVTATTSGKSIDTPANVAAMIKDIAPQYELLRNAAWAEVYNAYKG